MPGRLRFIRKGKPNLEGKMRLLAGNVRAAYTVLGAEWQAKMTRRFRPYSGAANGDGLQTRTGALRRSIGFTVRGRNAQQLELRLFSKGVPYAAIHEFGGRINGKPWLYIPLRLRRNGTLDPRWVTHRRGNRFETSRGERSFIIRSKAGNLVAMVTPSRGKGAGEPVPVGVLKRTVRMRKGRLGFRATWRSMRRRRKQELRRSLRATLDGQRRALA